jgi:hypothetical protein
MNAPNPNRIPLSLHPAAPLRAGAQAVVRGAIAALTGEVMNRAASEVILERWPQHKHLTYLVRGTTTPLTQTSANALAAIGFGSLELLNIMGGAYASSALLNAGLLLTFPAGVAALPILPLASNPTNLSWLGEGNAISVRQYDTTVSGSLSRYKLPVISIFTRETFRHTMPNIEDVVRTILMESIGPALDASLLDQVVSDGLTRPAGLRYNVAALTPSASTTRTEAMQEDVATLVGAVAPIAGNSLTLIIAAPKQAAALKLLPNQNFFPILASNALPDRTVMSVAARGLASAIDVAPRFSITDVPAVHMDTVASDIGSGGIPAGGVVKSLWQADLVGLKMILEVSWATRAPGSVAWMQSVVW